MRLPIDRDKLEKELQSWIDSDGYLFGDEKQAAQVLLACLSEIEISPAELDLAAVKVLGELRKWIVQEKETLGVHPHEGAIYQDVRQKLADLESSADLKPLQETLEKAKAWTSFLDAVTRDLTVKIPGKGSLDSREPILEALRRHLAQARAELDTSRNEVREKGEEDAPR